MPHDSNATVHTMKYRLAPRPLWKAKQPASSAKRNARVMTNPTKDGGESQGRKFIDTARELGCDEDEAAFDDKLKRIARHKPPPDEPKKPATKKPGQ